VLFWLLPSSNEQQIPHPPGEGGGFGMTWGFFGLARSSEQQVPSLNERQRDY
jgi:hypothetical protein